MLKSVTVENFTTYINKTVFDFQSKNYKFLEKENVGSDRILKGALFVGENASGKTNALKAIHFLLQMLMSNNELAFQWLKSFYTNKDTFSIEYAFVENSLDIVYKVVFNEASIVSELLTMNEEVQLERNSKTLKYRNGSGELVEKNSDMTPSAVFIRQYYFDTSFYDNKTLNKWYSSLKNSDYVNCNDHNITCSQELMPKIIANKYLEQNGNEEVNAFFKEIGYGQDIIYTSQTPKSRTSGKNFTSNIKNIAFRKEGTDVYIPQLFESTGNKTLIAILPTILHAIKNDCIIIVDEFSSGLHNALEESLLKYFFCYSKNSQIFFTTHSTNVLDNTILRPDQIYSIRFDGKNGSVIKRFSDEPLRELQNTEKMYLGGVIDDVPNYRKKFQD
jgi:AAA15 family ATPase/GTPase